ncbi:MAG: phytanoyl-CoA dioxygenase family protein [Gemmatimonadetes bacterium]|nr:phytanoyl-CoA dioxygenase family protein [Gemmatimonadota bacterium]MYD26183.1 phytanoyl-CoA dioxygenase family protein [Gemmatimonadota bacterium]
MSLTQAQIDQFNEQGFLPYEELLTPLEVKALHQRLEDIGNERVDFPDEYVQIEPRVELGDTQADPVRFNNVRKIWNLTKHDPVFKELARHPKILGVVRSLIGPDLKIYVDQTLCKPPRVGSAKPPHQDSAYWTSIDPPDLVICWIALNDATENNGCMRFISGSHKAGVIEHKHLEDFRVEDARVGYEREVAVPLKAGSCSFHHSLALHRTDANTSDDRRIGLTVAYMDAHSKYIGNGAMPEYDLVSGRAYEGCV